jgi:hypothetical protein
MYLFAVMRTAVSDSRMYSEIFLLIELIEFFTATVAVQDFFNRIKFLTAIVYIK